MKKFSFLQSFFGAVLAHFFFALFPVMVLLQSIEVLDYRHIRRGIEKQKIAQETVLAKVSPRDNEANFIAQSIRKFFR